MTELKQNTIKEIVIVGGGTAGWMTAAALSSMLPEKNVCITLIESEQIGTIGVGEATIPSIINFNRMLGINEAEFLAATKGTYKLGIEFKDWGRLGETYFHPFGAPGVDMNGIDFHQYWLYTKAAGADTKLEDYSVCAIAAKQAKFALPDDNPRSVLSHLKYAYHFDASKYAAFLRGYAEKRGVKRIEGKVEHVQQDTMSGAINGLKMENGAFIEGQLFFDCTGFKSLLLSKTLDVKFRDWSHWLPCNTAQTIATQSTEPLLPYTKSTAKSAGWQWRIPTQHRTGNGHIYSNDYMEDDEAHSILLQGLDGKPIGDTRTIRFKTGCVDKFWSKNCIGIGLSTGFLEPLESTSLFLIQQAISRFIALYPSAEIPNIVSNEYNRLMQREFEQVRDFIILHYSATQRSDSPFWNYCRNMPVPKSLQHKIDLFAEVGRVFRDEDELFSTPSWIAVFLGQNIFPNTYDPILTNIPIEEIQRSLSSMQVGMNKAIQQMPNHAAFLQRLTQK